MGAESDIGIGTEASEQAAHWFARLLDPDCTAAERATFERWRAANPAHDVAYRDLQRLWEQGGEVVREDEEVAAAAWRALKFRAPEKPARRRWLPAAALGTAAAVAALAVLYWPLSAPPAGEQYATVAGEQRTVTLADASTLTLDTSTVLVERYGRRERRVDLQQGQAHFQVRGDPRRPFVVHARGGTVTALGTRFQVRVEETGSAVTLLEGEVRVTTRAGGAAHSATLRPGERVEFAADGRLGAVQPADLRLAEGWTEGRLFVDDWPLQDLVTEINRYSDVQLRIDDPALRTLTVSGAFRTHDRDNLAKVLEQGWGIRATPVSEREVLLTRQ